MIGLLNRSILLPKYILPSILSKNGCQLYISFREYTENVRRNAHFVNLNITQAFGSTDSFVGRGRSKSNAQEQAKFLENEILKNANSSASSKSCCLPDSANSNQDEYQQLCNELLMVAEDDGSDQVSVHEPEEADEILNTEGPTIGQYEYGTFHKDGQMSTILKAKAIDPAATCKIVALKLTTPSQLHPPHNAQREARILIEARHHHVVQLLESFWYQGDRFVLAFPFLRQDLENLLRSGALTKRQISMVLTGLFEALKHVHSLGIIHRDVKPSNILLKTMEGPVFLADFGIAWSPTDRQSEPANAKITDVGTTCYRPPELLFGDKSYDSSLDMWAAGCVVAEMVRKTHERLFDPGPLGSELGLIKSIFTTLGTPNEQIWPSVKSFPDWGKVRFQQFPSRPWEELLEGASADAIHLVRQTVSYENTQRLTAAQALQHPAVTKAFT